MKRMDLFDELTYIDDDLILEAHETPVLRKQNILFRLASVTAIIFLMAISVFGVTSGRSEIIVTPTDNGSMVSFRSLDIWPVEESDWYPQNVPEGYEKKWIGSYEKHYRYITFVDDDDGKLMLAYGPARYMPGYSIDDHTGGEFIRVGKHEGRIFSAGTEEIRYDSGKPVSVQVYREWLFWVDGEQKLGFMLRYASTEKLDLISIAESIVQVDTLEATFQIEADAAVRKLGDYRPEWMTAGYEYVITYGSPVNPLMNRNEPGYVHRVYRNMQNYEVHLFYEYIPRHLSSTASAIIDIDADLLEASIDLNGTPATYYETPWGAAKAIVWQRQDVEGIPLTFSLYSDGISSTESISKDDLIHMAESIEMVNAADTSHFDRQSGK